MLSRDEFLRLLWVKNIDSYSRETWIDRKIIASDRFPDGPFSELGPLLRQLLHLGITRKDLSIFARAIAYDATFATLYALSDPGVNPSDSDALHESILSADPSGNEGRSSKTQNE